MSKGIGIGLQQRILQTVIMTPELRRTRDERSEHEHDLRKPWREKRRGPTCDETPKTAAQQPERNRLKAGDD
jgi:hypothetical protein